MNRNAKSDYPKLILITTAFLFAILAGSVPAQFGSAPGDSEALQSSLDFDRERRIEALSDEIRSLMSKQRYDEVVQKADELLAIDPGNSTARVWKDRAQYITSGETEQSDRPRLEGLPALNPRPLPTPAPIAAPQFTPVPLEERDRPASAPVFMGLSLPILIVVAVGALILLAVLVIAIVSATRRRKNLQEALKEASARGGATAPAAPEPSGDMHDAVTQVSGETRADEDSVVQYGSVGTSDTDALSDRDRDTPSGQEGGQEAPGGETAPPPPAVQQAREEDVEEKTQSLEAVGAMEEPPREEPHTEEQESLEFGQPEPKQPEPAAEEDEALSFSSAMFDSEGETKEPEDGGGAGAEEADSDALTFNSLMFDDSEETKMPEASAKQEQQRPSADEEEGDEALSFNSLMFDEGEETVAPGGASATGEDDDLEKTVALEGGLTFGEDEPETREEDEGGLGETLPLPPPPGEDDDDLSQTINLFENAEDEEKK